MVVDFHAHYFSRTFFETLAAQSPRAGSVEDRLEAVAARTGIEIPPADPSAHLARWLEELDRHRVDHLMAFASLPEEIPVLREAVAAAGGRLSSCALVDPTRDGAAARVRRLLAEEGFSGVLLFPAMHHYRLGEARCADLLAVLDEHAALAYVHCGVLVVKLRDLLGLPRPYDLAYADPLAIVPAANRAPRATFVVPHFGAGFFRETLMLGACCENVVVDTSSSNAWIRTQPSAPALADVFARTLEVFGPGRVLFGTDSGTFPAGWRAERLEEQRAILAAQGVDADAVLDGNARRLLRLGPA